MTLRTVNGKWLIVDGKLAADANCCCSPPAPPCEGPCDEEATCPEGCYCVDGECSACLPCEYAADCAELMPNAECCDGCCELGCTASESREVEGIPLTQPNTAKGAEYGTFASGCARTSAPNEFPFPLPGNSTQLCPTDCPEGFVEVASSVRIYDPDGNILAEEPGVCCPQAVFDDPCESNPLP
jgi:hypothetical protein